LESLFLYSSEVIRENGEDQSGIEFPEFRLSAFEGGILQYT